MKALLIVLLATFGLSTAAQAKSKSGSLLAGAIIGAALHHNLSDHNDSEDYSYSDRNRKKKKSYNDRYHVDRDNDHDSYYDEDSYYNDRYDSDSRDRRRRRADRDRRRRRRDRDRDRRRRDRDRDHDDYDKQCSRSQSVQLLCEIKDGKRKHITGVTGQVDCSGREGDTCYNVYFKNYYTRKLNVTFSCRGGQWEMAYTKNAGCYLEK